MSAGVNEPNSLSSMMHPSGAHLGHRDIIAAAAGAELTRTGVNGPTGLGKSPGTGGTRQLDTL